MAGTVAGDGSGIDWIGAFRRVVEQQAELFAREVGIAGRTVYEGLGEGGDMALAIDRRCEDLVFDELEALLDGRGALAVSEERGEVVIGAGGGGLRVIIDPIDGSLNARRTLPSHCLSIAVASDDSMAAVELAFVHDFGAGEEFVARAGGGAELNGAPLRIDGPDHGLEVVGIESAEPSWILPSISALAGTAYRLRAIGSIAISLCYVAAGRFDAMLSARPCRSVDAAAAQLLVREAGGVVEFAGHELAEARLGLDARYPVAAARDRERLQTVRAAQDAGPGATGTPAAGPGTG